MVEIEQKSLLPAAGAPLGLQVKIKLGSQIGKSEKVPQNGSDGAIISMCHTFVAHLSSM